MNNMTGKMVFNFKIDEKDYQKSLICMTFGIQKWKRTAILIVWIAAAIAFILNLLKVIHLSSVVYTCALLVFVIVGTAFITTLINIYKYKKTYKKGKNIRRQIVTDDKGITFKNSSTEESGFNEWSEINRIQELEDAFIIGVNARDAIILPKRAMENEDNIEEFIDLVTSKINGRFMGL